MNSPTRFENGSKHTLQSWSVLSWPMFNPRIDTLEFLVISDICTITRYSTLWQIHIGMVGMDYMSNTWIIELNGPFSIANSCTHDQRLYPSIPKLHPPFIPFHSHYNYYIYYIPVIPIPHHYGSSVAAHLESTRPESLWILRTEQRSGGPQPEGGPTNEVYHGLLTIYGHCGSEESESFQKMIRIAEVTRRLWVKVGTLTNNTS